MRKMVLHMHSMLAPLGAQGEVDRSGKALVIEPQV